MKNRRLLQASGVAAATLAMLLLTGCSTDSDSDATDAATAASAAALPTVSSMEPTEGSASMIGPIMVMPGTTEVDATVGRSLNFKVEGDPGNWLIESDSPEVVEVTQGGEQDGAVFNPGGKALMAGTAKVTLSDKAGDGVWEVTVTVS